MVTTLGSAAASHSFLPAPKMNAYQYAGMSSFSHSKPRSMGGGQEKKSS